MICLVKNNKTKKEFTKKDKEIIALVNKLIRLA